MAPVVKNLPANAGEMWVQSLGQGLSPRSGRSPNVGNGNPLQYSCLENSMERGAWRATVPGVSKSQTWLSDWTCTHTHTHTDGYDLVKCVFYSTGESSQLELVKHFFLEHGCVGACGVWGTRGNLFHNGIVSVWPKQSDSNTIAEIYKTHATWFLERLSAPWEGVKMQNGKMTE